MSRGETRSEGEKTQTHNESVRKRGRRRLKQWAGRRAGERESIFHTSLRGAGRNYLSEHWAEERAQVLWRVYRVMLDKLSVWVGPMLHSLGPFCYCAVDQKMALAMLLWVIKWLRTSKYSPSKTSLQVEFCLTLR